MSEDDPCIPVAQNQLFRNMPVLVDHVINA